MNNVFKFRVLLEEVLRVRHQLNDVDDAHTLNKSRVFLISSQYVSQLLVVLLVVGGKGMLNMRFLTFFRCRLLGSMLAIYDLLQSHEVC